MIINVRGTSGSGKSTLVRKIMDQYDHKVEHHIAGRRQPIAYTLTKLGSPNLAVIGHYETACGGCDTISKMDDIFRRVRQAHNNGCNVLFEGLLISADVKRMAMLAQEYPCMVVALDQVPIEQCIASVNERRMARMGPEKFRPVKEDNTRSKFRGVELSLERLAEQDVAVYSCNREEALETVERALDLT